MRAVLFDLDGVLRRWDPALIAEAEFAHHLPRGSLARTAFEEPWLYQAVTGILSDIDWRVDIASRLARRTGAPASAAAAAVAQWSASPGSLDPDVLEILRAQRRVRTVALLSNATSRLDADLERLGLLDEVDAVYNSSRLGVAKPDGAIFDAVVTDLGLPAADCAFVDDTLGHVRAAAAAGLRGHHFTGVEALSKFLATHV